MLPKVKLTVCVIFLTVIFIEIVQMAELFKMTNAICESRNKSWVTIDRCRLKAISRNKTVLTVEATVLYPAKNIHLSLQFMKKANGYKPWLGNYTVDACAYMRKPNHPVIKAVFGIFKKFSSINHKCPYVGKQMLKDFDWDPTNYTVFVPSGDYLLLLTWIFDRRPQFVTNVYFTLAHDLLKD